MKFMVWKQKLLSSSGFINNVIGQAKISINRSYLTKALTPNSFLFGSRISQVSRTIFFCSAVKGMTACSVNSSEYQSINQSINQSIYLTWSVQCA